MSVFNKVLGVEITAITPINGATAADKNIWKTFQNKKAQEANAARAEQIGEEVIDHPLYIEPAEIELQGMSIFPRDKNDFPCLMAYQIKGHFKAACFALSRFADTESRKLRAYKTVIDTCVFIMPFAAPFDQKVSSEYARTVRHLDKNGMVTSIKCSEQVPEGTKCRFQIRYGDLAGPKPKLPPKTPPKPDAVVKAPRIEPVPDMTTLIKEWLEYGELLGYLEHRSGGYGSFTVKYL